VNVVDLESYLQGVVAGEVPSNWPRETLRAQAVAARSYALSHLVMKR
jgi:stage II sporulation protein D